DRRGQKIQRQIEHIQEQDHEKRRIEKRLGEARTLRDVDASHLNDDDYQQDDGQDERHRHNAEQYQHEILQKFFHSHEITYGTWVTTRRIISTPPTNSTT